MQNPTHVFQHPITLLHFTSLHIMLQQQATVSSLPKFFIMFSLYYRSSIRYVNSLSFDPNALPVLHQVYLLQKKIYLSWNRELREAFKHNSSTFITLQKYTVKISASFKSIHVSLPKLVHCTKSPQDRQIQK